MHSTRKDSHQPFDKDNAIKSKPYDIPLRALVAADIDNLLFAGRCISGDFLSHSSYRVTGNSVPTGEAVGCLAALVSQGACHAGQPVAAVPFADIVGAMRSLSEPLGVAIPTAV